jgi:hypothetical protein
MPESPSSTQFVKSSEEYEAPSRSFDRMRAITAKHQPVDGNGFDRPRAKPDDSVTAIVEPTSAVPTMSEALTAVAAQTGADLADLLDSASFCAAIGGISPSDTAGLLAAIADHQPPVPSTGMQQNPSQGRSAAGPVSAPAAGTLLERVQAQAAKSLSGQPEPPGSTFR